MSNIKVIRSDEMARIEQLAFKEGTKEEELMKSAGMRVAQAVMHLVSVRRMKKKVTLLAGKGNNGGDAFAAAIQLLKQKYSVDVFFLFPVEDFSPLCRKQYDLFVKEGGGVYYVRSLGDLVLDKEAILIDGLLGTGCKGPVEGVLQEVVKKINDSSLFVVSIDIPSGVNGNNGEVVTEAIKADLTIALTTAKSGFFLKDGWNYVGELMFADIGFPKKYLDMAQASFYIPDLTNIKKLLPKISRTRHKYDAGYVVGFAGSYGMGGAAKLSSLAALRSGCGIVRLFSLASAKDEMAFSPYEVIRDICSVARIETILQHVKKANALYVGPGMGRYKETMEFLAAFLPKINKPCVLDADALYFLAKYPKYFIKKSILTPHRNEMLRLLGIEKEDEDDVVFLKRCQKFCDEKDITLVLKGAPTYIFHPKKECVVMPWGDPGMATAGSGDVLCGIITSFLAQGLNPYSAATLGVYLHGLSGEVGANVKTSYGLIASDIVDAMPHSFKMMQK